MPVYVGEVTRIVADSNHNTSILCDRTTAVPASQGPSPIALSLPVPVVYS